MKTITFGDSSAQVVVFEAAEDSELLEVVGVEGENALGLIIDKMVWIPVNEKEGKGASPAGTFLVVDPTDQKSYRISLPRVLEGIQRRIDERMP